MPEANANTVRRAYQHGLELARGGRFFEAHEAFEEAWRACGAEERDFFQGLVHVVVSAYQRGRGRPVAEERQRVKALRRLAPYAPAHRGLDVELLLQKLDRAEADPREHLVERDLQPPAAVEEEEQPERDERGP
jgi:predicted metal-dependent hydrolase